MWTRLVHNVDSVCTNRVHHFQSLLEWHSFDPRPSPDFSPWLRDKARSLQEDLKLTIFSSVFDVLLLITASFGFSSVTFSSTWTWGGSGGIRWTGVATSSSSGGGASLVVMATVGSEGSESCQKGRKERKRGRKEVRRKAGRNRGRRREGEKKERERREGRERWRKNCFQILFRQIQISTPPTSPHPNC